MPKTSGNRGGYEKALNSVDGDKVGKKRFKWMAFNELVQRIDVGREVHRGIRDVQLDPAGGAESFVQQELARWTELDLSATFRKFNNEIYPLVQSLPQLLHHRETVVGRLLHFLTAPGSTSVLALLDLATHIARDLREEFWPFFPAAVRAVTTVLASTGKGQSGSPTYEAEVFGAAFRCLVRS
eukprot:SAG22_NODE_611_length_8586_cov_8.288795_4_plen_183_part_00